MPKPITVDLPERLTIMTAESLHELLEPHLQSQKDLVLNAENVERVDTAGLQVLLSFCQTLKGQNIGVTWSSPTEALSDGAVQLGIADILAIS